MKHRINIFFVCSLLFVTAIIAIFFFCGSKTNKQDEKHLSMMAAIQDVMSSFETNIKIGIMSEGCSLQGVIIRTIENQEFEISELINSPKLILRYSLTGCESCIINELELLETDNRISKDNLYVLITGGNSRMLKIFDEQNHSFQILRCENIPIPFDEVGKLYAFVLDSSLVIKDFYIPNNNAPRLSRSYYDAVFNKYFK